MIARGFWRFVQISVRIGAILPAFLLGLPLQALALRFDGRFKRILPVFFHRYLLFVLGVRLRQNGQRAANVPLLIAANHVSWLDIVVISSLFPVSFIAKSEIAAWPIFGTLARLQRSIFVERARPGKTADTNRAIGKRMQAGDTIVLFAEGTTSDGTRILPFRSALIGAAHAAIETKNSVARIQSLNIAYSKIAGLPIGRADHPFIAWYGDMDLVPHLMDFFTLASVDVSITLGEPHDITPESDRKALTRLLEAEVRQAHTRALKGHEV
jgi:lyso-ornithine lipid O-acyltransferase